MMVEVTNRGFTANEPVRNYVALRLMSVLDHLERQIRVVAVSLLDARDGDGRAGKRCRMVALMVRSGALRVEATDSSFFAAIDGAAAELARVAVGQFGRGDAARPSVVGQ